MSTPIRVRAYIHPQHKDSDMEDTKLLVKMVKLTGKYFVLGVGTIFCLITYISLVLIS